MEKEFVTYEIALGLKELGFGEPCFGFYEKEILKPTSYVNDFDHGTNHGVDFENVFKTIPVPLYQQAFKFFREKYKLHQVILADEKGKYDIIVGERISGSCLGQYSTYEEAELECLKKLIELVKN